MDDHNKSISSPAFTLAIVASYIFTLLSGSLLLIAGIANYQIASGNSFPGPGMFPLMASSPYGEGIMYPMMVSNPILLGWSSIIGIIIGGIVLGTAILLYIYPKYQMVWGSITVSSAIIGLISGGGFFIGSVLGIVAGIIAITVRIR